MLNIWGGGGWWWIDLSLLSGTFLQITFTKTLLDTQPDPYPYIFIFIFFRCERSGFRKGGEIKLHEHQFYHRKLTNFELLN